MEWRNVQRLSSHYQATVSLLQYNSFQSYGLVCGDNVISEHFPLYLMFSGRDDGHLLNQMQHSCLKCHFQK